MTSYLFHPVVHHLRYVEPSCRLNTFPEILGDGIFVLVLLQVERYTFKEGLLADVA